MWIMKPIVMWYEENITPSTHEEIHWSFARWMKAKELNMEPGSLASSHFRFFFVWHLGCSFLDLLHRSRVHNSPRWITQTWYCFFILDRFLCKQKVQDWRFHQHYGWWYCLILLGWIEILSLRKSVFSLIHTKSFRVRPRKLTWNPKIGGLQMSFLFQRGILSFHVNFRGVCIYVSNFCKKSSQDSSQRIHFISSKTPGNLVQDCNL